MQCDFNNGGACESLGGLYLCSEHLEKDNDEAEAFIYCLKILKIKASFHL